MANQKSYRLLVEQSGVQWSRLAAVTGMRPARLSEWRHGKTELRPDELLKIMAVMTRRVMEIERRAGDIKIDTNLAHGWQLRQVRAEFGITQSDLAKKSGFTQTEISLFETGKSSLSPKQTDRIFESCIALAEAQNAALAARNKSLQDQVEALNSAAKSSRLVKLSSLLMSDAELTAAKPIPPLPDKTLREFVREVGRAGRELERKERQIEMLNMRVANLTNQVISLQEQNASLREWLEQEQTAALEQSKANDLKDKVLKPEE